MLDYQLEGLGLKKGVFLVLDDSKDSCDYVSDWFHMCGGYASDEVSVILAVSCWIDSYGIKILLHGVMQNGC